MYRIYLFAYPYFLSVCFSNLFLCLYNFFGRHSGLAVRIVASQQEGPGSIPWSAVRSLFVFQWPHGFIPGTPVSQTGKKESVCVWLSVSQSIYISYVYVCLSLYQI